MIKRSLGYILVEPWPLFVVYDNDSLNRNLYSVQGWSIDFSIQIEVYVEIKREFEGIGDEKG